MDLFYIFNTKHNGGSMPWWCGITFLAILCLNYGVTLSDPDVFRGNRRSHNLFRSGTGLFSNGIPRSQNHQPSNSNIDIEFDNEPMEEAGSGNKGTSFQDDEDLGISGSGSGSGFDSIHSQDELTMTTTTTTTTVRQPTTTSTTTRTMGIQRELSQCEKSRKSNKSVNNKHVPECLASGLYAALQCTQLPGTNDCWCADLNGKEIHNTRMEAPNYPNCDEGDNLPQCVFDLVKSTRRSSGLLGSFRPICTIDGQYKGIQCRGSMCFCVDESTGQKKPGTEARRHEHINCSEKPVVILPEKPVHVVTDGKPVSVVRTTATIEKSDDRIETGLETPDDSDEEDPVTMMPPYVEKPRPKEMDKEVDPQIDFPDPNGSDAEENVNIDVDSEDEMGDKSETSDENNETGGLKDGSKIGSNKESSVSSVETASEIVTQPGILAAIIGGAVVVSLCLVLLIMFIIYRMRKKDEGSYPLDEPKRPLNYSYVRTPDREFYA